MRKSIQLYVIAAGLPLIGLLAILGSGAAVVPPTTAQGTWASASEDAASCSGSKHDVELRIQQFGRFLRVAVDDMRFFGRGWLHAPRRHTRVPVPIDVCASSDLAVEADFADGSETLPGVTCCADRCGDCPASTLAPRVDPAGY